MESENTDLNPDTWLWMGAEFDNPNSEFEFQIPILGFYSDAQSNLVHIASADHVNEKCIPKILPLQSIGDIDQIQKTKHGILVFYYQKQTWLS